MDGQRFDALTRHLSSRRTALGGLLAGLTLLPLDAAARIKGKRRKGKGNDRQRVSAQDSCWRAGACIPKKGSNVSQCDLSGYTTFPTADCTGCNVSRANLRGVNASGVNFTRANLSGSCLVDATFTNATFANSTNLSGATFCRTKMPDGSINYSGCGNATACCPTCNRSAGMTCGTPGNICCDGALCRNGVCVACSGASCGAGQLCCNGVCVANDTTNCGACGTTCNPSGATPACNGATCVCTTNSCPSGQTCQGGTCTPVTSQCLMECPSQDAAGSAFCAALPGPCKVCRFMRDSITFVCTEI